MVLTAYDRQHVGLLQCEFGLLLLTKILDMIQNVNAAFVNKTIQHVNLRAKTRMLQETLVNVMPFDATGVLSARSSAAMALTMSIEDCYNSIFKE